jgi:lysozyme family protein
MPRWNQVDFALRRNFTVGRMHLQAQLEVFNAFNANTVLTEGTALSTRLNPFVPGTTPAITAPNYTFASNDAMSGGTPNSILSPRLVRIGAQIKF